MMIVEAKHDSDKIDGCGSGGRAEGCTKKKFALQPQILAIKFLCKTFFFSSVHAHIKQESDAPLLSHKIDQSSAAKRTLISHGGL